MLTRIPDRYRRHHDPPLLLVFKECNGERALAEIVKSYQQTRPGRLPDELAAMRFSESSIRSATWSGPSLPVWRRACPGLCLADVLEREVHRSVRVAVSTHGNALPGRRVRLSRREAAV